jgi:hypothetical protein
MENNSKTYETGTDCRLLTDADDPGLYPFVPFTNEEWQNLNYRDKLERRQIPEDFLQKMKTEALFFQFAGCDLSPGIYLHNSLQAGFEAMTKQLNMLPELLNRTDAGHVLLVLLQKVELSKIGELGCLHFYECLQRIIAQPKVINNLSNDDVNKYISLMILHQQIIRDLSQKTDFWSYPESSAAILFGLGNLMLRFEYEPFMLLLETNSNVNGLMNGANPKDEQVVSLINNCITEFMNRSNQGI